MVLLSTWAEMAAEHLDVEPDTEAVSALAGRFLWFTPPADAQALLVVRRHWTTSERIF